jgi:hypothetical protein
LQTYTLPDLLQVSLPHSLASLCLDGFSAIPPDLSRMTRLEKLKVESRALRQPFHAFQLPPTLTELVLMVSLPGNEQPQWGPDHSLFACEKLSQLKLYFTRHRGGEGDGPHGQFTLRVPAEINKLTSLDHLEIYAYSNKLDPGLPQFSSAIILPSLNVPSLALPASGLGRVQVWATFVDIPPGTCRVVVGRGHHLRDIG